MLIIWPKDLDVFGLFELRAAASTRVMSLGGSNLTSDLDVRQSVLSSPTPYMPVLFGLIFDVE